MTGWLRNHEKLGYDLLLLPLTYYKLQYYIPYFIQLKKWVKIMQCQICSLWLIVQCTITFEAISEERSLGQIALYMDFRGALFTTICSGNGSRIIKLFEIQYKSNLPFFSMALNFFSLIMAAAMRSTTKIFKSDYQHFFYPNVIHRP